MMRAYSLLASLAVAVSGCTITTQGGGGPETPEPQRVASEERPHRTRARPHKTPKPAPTPEKPTTVEPKPEPERPSTKPDRPSTKPDPKPPVVAQPKPEPKPPVVVKPKPPTSKPEPEATPPTTKPDEPKPEAKPKPRPKPPKAKPKPRPKPPKAKPEPKPQPPKTKPEPKPKPKPKPPNDERGFVFGVPPEMEPGHPSALWIYQDADGWHFRTTANQVLRKFLGKIWVTEGKIVSATASTGEGKNEINDKLRVAKKEVLFVFATFGRMDGVDLRVSGTKCVHVEVTVDGKVETQLVYLGATMVHPAGNPFEVCGR
jgi:hypothetical protein